MKKLIFLLILFSFGYLICSEQSYGSNWKPNEDVIETNFNQINSIKNETLKKLRDLICILKIEAQRIKNRADKKTHIVESVILVKFLSKALKYLTEHQFKKALDVLKTLKKLRINNNIKNQIDTIYSAINQINNICSKWLSDQTGLPDALSRVVNEYALPHIRELVLNAHENTVSSVSWSPDDQNIASCAYYNPIIDEGAAIDKTIIVWDVESGTEKIKLEGHEKSIYSVVWSPCGKYIASGSQDKTVRIWNVKTGQEKEKLEGHELWVRSVAWSPDGKNIVSCSDDNRLIIWDIESENGQKLEGDGYWIYSVSWSSNGQFYIATGSEKTVKVWQKKRYFLWNTWICIQSFDVHNSYCNSISWSPNSEYLASCNGKTVIIWNLKTGKQIRQLEGHEGSVFAIAWSPCGKYIASGSRDKTLRVWDIEKGIEIKRFEGHEGIINSVSWSSDSQNLASGSDDRTVRIWWGKPHYV